MRLSLRFGLITVQVVTVLMLISGLADSTVYTWQDETGVVTFSDNPNSAPNGIQAKVFLNESPRQEVSEARATEEVPGQSSGVPSTVVTQGEFAVHLARELGYSEGQTPEEAARILSNIPIIPPFGGWDLDASMTPEITSRLRTVTIAAPQRGWISVTPEQARHAFDSAAALMGVPIPVDRDTALLEPLPPDQGVTPLGVITQGEFAVRLSRELGLGQDLTDEEATRILSDLRIPPYYTWVTVPSGFPWQGSTAYGFFALHSVHINIHFFNGHRFAFRPHFVRHHFLDHLRGRHLVKRHVIRHQTGGGRHKGRHWSDSVRHRGR